VLFGQFENLLPSIFIEKIINTMSIIEINITHSVFIAYGLIYYSYHTNYEELIFAVFLLSS
jgi:hypothetical protein